MSRWIRIPGYRRSVYATQTPDELTRLYESGTPIMPYIATMPRWTWLPRWMWRFPWLTRLEITYRIEDDTEGSAR